MCIYLVSKLFVWAIVDMVTASLRNSFKGLLQCFCLCAVLAAMNCRQPLNLLTQFKPINRRVEDSISLTSLLCSFLLS